MPYIKKIKNTQPSIYKLTNDFITKEQIFIIVENGENDIRNKIKYFYRDFLKNPAKSYIYKIFANKTDYTAKELRQIKYELVERFNNINEAKDNLKKLIEQEKNKIETTKNNFIEQITTIITEKPNQSVAKPLKVVETFPETPREYSEMKNKLQNKYKSIKEECEYIKSILDQGDHIFKIYDFLNKL